MPALTAGKVAPSFDLPSMEGRKFSLRDALQSGPVVLAFFKVTCPVCQYAMPFIERIYRAHKGKAQVIAVSQHPKKETQAFMSEYGITMPVLLDDPASYAVSNAYGLTNVPTIFLIDADGQIEISTVGWDKKDVEKINRHVAESISATVPALFHRGEQVIDFKAG
jgi:peroxiredoxin